MFHYASGGAVHSPEGASAAVSQPMSIGAPRLIFHSPCASRRRCPRCRQRGVAQYPRLSVVIEWSAAILRELLTDREGTASTDGAVCAVETSVKRIVRGGPGYGSYSDRSRKTVFATGITAVTMERRILKSAHPTCRVVQWCEAVPAGERAGELLNEGSAAGTQHPRVVGIEALLKWLERFNLEPVSCAGDRPCRVRRSPEQNSSSNSTAKSTLSANCRLGSLRLTRRYRRRPRSSWSRQWSAPPAPELRASLSPMARASSATTSALPSTPFHGAADACCAPSIRRRA